MSHHHYVRRTFDKAHNNKLVQYALVAAGIVLLLLLGLVVGLIVLVVHFLGMPATGLEQALSEALDTAQSWWQPVVDLYNRVTGLIPGVE